MSFNNAVKPNGQDLGGHKAFGTIVASSLIVTVTFRVSLGGNSGFLVISEGLVKEVGSKGIFCGLLGFLGGYKLLKPSLRLFLLLLLRLGWIYL